MWSVRTFLTRTRGRGGPDLTDWVAYAYLVMGLLLVFVPVLWMAISSFKPDKALRESDPRLLPYQQLTVDLQEELGNPRAGALPLVFAVDPETGERRSFAQEGVQGATAILIDHILLKETETLRRVEVPRLETTPDEQMRPRWANYKEPISSGKFNFFSCFGNSIFVTVVATLVTLLINSMAAFALSRYRFRGRSVFMFIIIATLLIPPSIILVSLFLVVDSFNMFNSLWGVIIPGAATPTGVFLLRQYMLTIPEELLEAARMDGASEWKIYWRIMLPLSLPALAVLAILSVIWRWNDFLWPLIVLHNSELHTLQLCLNVFRGENISNDAWLLSMTVLSLLPVTLVFAFLQRFITTGIASSGMK